MSATVNNPFQHIVEPLDPKDPTQQFYNLSKLGDPRYGNGHSLLYADMKLLYRVICILLISIPARFHVNVFFRASPVLHPGPPGVCCQELWWVPGEELRCGEHPELEAYPDSNCGGPVQTGSSHPAGLHVSGPPSSNQCQWFEQRKNIKQSSIV